MDNKNSLSTISLSHTSTPKSHTCNPNPTSSSTPADEDAGDEETDVGELGDGDGQNVETALVDFDGEQPRTVAEHEWSRELQPATDEDFYESNGNQTFMEMNGTQPYEKDGNLRPESSGSKLGFGAAMEDAIDENSKFSANERFNIDEFLHLANKVIDKGDAQSMEALVELKRRWVARFGCERSRLEVEQPRLPATDISVDSYPLARDFRQTFRQRLRTKQQSMEIRNSKSAADQFPRAIRCVRAVEKAPEFIRPTTVYHQPAMDTPADEELVVGESTEVFPLATVPASAATAANPNSATVPAATVPAATVPAATIAAATVPAATVTATVTDSYTSNNFRNGKVANSHTGIFVGNIPLQTTLDDCFGDDKIARAFNNSTRKTLTYVEPMRQNGEVVVRPSLDIVRDGSKRWQTTAVGYFLGKRPYYHHLKEYTHSVWPALREVNATANGFFFFQFKSVIDMEEVIEGGPWLFQGQPIVLQKWEPGMAMRKLKHTQAPVWIKLRHLPMEFWTTDGLSTVASGVGKPLYPDAITRACMRLDFARVCVMVDVSQNLPNHVIIMTPDEDGGETPCKVDVEYEWLPKKCLDCMTLGHSTKECPLTKPKKTTKPPVAVYVPKPFTARATTEPVRVQKPRQDCEGVNGMKNGDNPTESNTTRQDNRGKEVVIYNAFEALHLIDDTNEQSGGPNTSSPIGHDPC
ncbi:UNVERIFIED_CONTAM: hypothetical protein Sindi_2016700 [Sesamum indicum]